MNIFWIIDNLWKKSLDLLVFFSLKYIFFKYKSFFVFENIDLKLCTLMYYDFLINIVKNNYFLKIGIFWFIDTTYYLHCNKNIFKIKVSFIKKKEEQTAWFYQMWTFIIYQLN